jgi:basic amino acid/polyamine antiporter, APA family
MSELHRGFTLGGLIMLAIGASIGSGIFLTPSEIAQSLPSEQGILTVWLLGGLITMMGALTFAELGAMFPRAGGIYLFLKEAYGPLVAFLYGWTMLLVSNTGSIAALSLAFAKYIGFIFPLGNQGPIWLALVVIWVATLVNLFGVGIAQRFAKLFTGLKISGILFIVVAGIYAWVTKGRPMEIIEHSPTWKDYGLALIAVMWSYGGWQHASFVAGEAKNPERTVPLAMVGGALSVMVLYILINLGYLGLLSPGAMAASKAVAAEGLSRIAPWGGIFVAWLIAISTFGTTGIYTTSAPRIFYAMAEDKLFFPFLTKIHPKWKVPLNAILLQSFWASVLLLFWGTFNNLITYVTFMDLVFFVLATLSVIVLRKKHPEWHRPYHTFAYPITPILYALMNGVIIVSTLIQKPEQSLWGLGLLVTGIPVYWWFQKKSTT